MRAACGHRADCAVDGDPLDDVRADSALDQSDSVMMSDMTFVYECVSYTNRICFVHHRVDM